MAVFYPVSSLLTDLRRVQWTISEKDSKSLVSLAANIDSYGLSTIKYNMVLDFWNKYVAVPAGVVQYKRDHYYPSTELEEFQNGLDADTRY